jgi:general secretion pathway protein H
VTRRSIPANFRRRSAEHGFTLIELMVVIVIIGLMSATIVLTMSDPRGRMGDDADKFSGRVRAARDSAIINARPIALWVSQTGYGFDQRRAGRWEPVREGPLSSMDWSKGISAKAGQTGQARVIFDTVGRADQPLTLTLDRDERTLAIRMDLDGKVTTSE